ncbi:MAG TPA: DUF2905 domain-containing protein [Bryobacterales bacterium]|nr:DUF2905 domain-containing protein [Bryobacterales bacterium]
MSLGRLFVLFGLILVAIGLLVMAAEKLPFFRLGRLPGDIVYRGKNVTFYFPLATCILLSVLLTLLFSLFRRR